MDKEKLDKRVNMLNEHTDTLVSIYACMLCMIIASSINAKHNKTDPRIVQAIMTFNLASMANIAGRIQRHLDNVDKEMSVHKIIRDSMTIN